MRFDRDRNRVAYHSGGDQVAIPGLVESLKRGLSGEAGANPSSERFQEGSSGKSPDVAAGLLLTALHLLWVNPDYYQSSYLRGKCVCGEPGTNIEIPCPHVTVNLLDKDGTKVDSLTTDDGEFAFLVAPKKNYYLSVESSHYQLKKTPTHPLEMGDSVILPLIPTQNASETGSPL